MSAFSCASLEERAKLPSCAGASMRLATVALLFVFAGSAAVAVAR